MSPIDNNSSEGDFVVYVSKSMQKLHNRKINKGLELEETKEIYKNECNNLKTTQKSWRGFLVRVLNGSNGILGKLQNIMLKFEWYKNEVEVQNKFKKIIQFHKVNIINLEKQISNINNMITKRTVKYDFAPMAVKK